MTQMEALWLASKDAVVLQYGSAVLHWEHQTWNIHVQIAMAEISALPLLDFYNTMQLYRSQK